MRNFELLHVHSASNWRWATIARPLKWRVEGTKFTLHNPAEHRSPIGALTTASLLGSRSVQNCITLIGKAVSSAAFFSLPLVAL